MNKEIHGITVYHCTVNSVRNRIYIFLIESSYFTTTTTATFSDIATAIQQY